MPLYTDDAAAIHGYYFRCSFMREVNDPLQSRQKTEPDRDWPLPRDAPTSRFVSAVPANDAKAPNHLHHTDAAPRCSGRGGGGHRPGWTPSTSAGSYDCTGGGMVAGVQWRQLTSARNTAGLVVASGVPWGAPGKRRSVRGLEFDSAGSKPAAAVVTACS